MKIHQLSLFIENKAGQLTEPCALLADAGINILTLMLADTQQFGILRLIVRDWDKTKTLLEDNGHVVNVTEVVAIEVPDRPGGIKEIIEIIDTESLNIEYMYAFTSGRKDKSVIIFRFEDVDNAIEVLKDKGVNVIGSIDLFDQVENS